MRAKVSCGSNDNGERRFGRLCLGAFLLACSLGAPGWLARAQSAVPAPALTQAVSAAQQTVPEEIRRAAEAGDAKAQYAAAWTELDIAAVMSRKISTQWGTNFNSRAWLTPFSQAEQDAARAKWSAVPEADARQAGRAGDRGAQWFINRLDNDRLYSHVVNAFGWFKQAAAQSYPPAEFEAASFCLHLGGWNVGDRDEKQGLDLLRRATEHGFEPAQHRWAELLLDGGLLPPDVPRAIELLRLAADQGCPRAQFELAEQYTCGNGQPRSAEETPVALLTKAAKAGVPDAQLALGDRSRRGLGVEKNPARAWFWYYVAARWGSRDAAARRQKVEGGLSPEQLAQAKRWVAEFEEQAKRTLATTQPTQPPTHRSAW